MKIPLNYLLVLVVVLLTGCAGTHETVRQDPPMSPAGSIVQDDQYVSVVENIAKQRGIQVTWVNPPKKRLKQMGAMP